jgi:hypothetical protein
MNESMPKHEQHMSEKELEAVTKMWDKIIKIDDAVPLKIYDEPKIDFQEIKKQVVDDMDRDIHSMDAVLPGIYVSVDRIVENGPEQAKLVDHRSVASYLWNKARLRGQHEIEKKILDAMHGLSSSEE